MAKDPKIDQMSTESRIEEGEEMVAVWLPMTQDEKKAIMEKATSEGVKLPALLADFIKSWMQGGKSAELNIEDLAQVAGGAKPFIVKKTTMCPW